VNQTRWIQIGKSRALSCINKYAHIKGKELDDIIHDLVTKTATSCYEFRKGVKLLSKYDDLLKGLARLNPKDFVQWLCPQFPKIEKVTFVDREFELTYRRVDTLYKVKAKQVGAFLLHLEFQATLSDDLSMRLHEYSARIHRALKSPVKTVVVFLDSTRAIKTLEPVDRIEIGGEIVSEFHYTKIILPEEYWGQIVAKGLPAILPLIPFTKIPQGEERQALSKAAESIENLQNTQIRAELAATLYLLSGYSYSKTIEEVIKEKLMQELMLSETYRKVTEAGEVKGESKAKREDLFKILKRLFGQIPPELQEQLEGIRSVKKLDTLIDLALASTSLDEFQTQMEEQD
jgi:predicted transposase YdaD